MTDSNHCEGHDKGVKYFVIWEDRRIGYFLDGIYYGKTDFPEGIGEDFSLTDEYLIRKDGTKFLIVHQDDKDALSKTRSANGGFI
ncbi:hypothetical protein [Vibrio fluvialis]|uniref:hypothetical protein n=1 Tax=Vibrio fluvialis TaxID=676 RepID=UPI00192ADFE9|nr:hypothetical protein [Vibrio fluvialis]EKO3429962.1 hypothetical protein [Vibrio fluvialis]ELE8120260.1 hypothetical protein [Vibrio fluvialis]MBL4286856.1 hypothetical protein [Vibrio fluvialis]MBL4291255.1 hypothetical protein [Vibrio fluvialis]MBL4305322.1 hypothetical protein [Vibrio fluvialis]